MLKIKELRNEFKYSQQELADLLGYQQQTVARHENGINEPDIEALIKYARVFKVSVDYLIGNNLLRNELLSAEEQSLVSGLRQIPLSISDTIIDLVSKIANDK